MHDFLKLATQVSGARALLGWSQAYLAEGLNVSCMTIADIENCKRKPQTPTLVALMTELRAAGIVFTETGVEFLEWPPRSYVPSGCTTIKKRARRKYYSRGAAGNQLKRATEFPTAAVAGTGIACGSEISSGRD